MYSHNYLQWVEKKCHVCAGRRVVNRDQQMVAHVEKGMKDKEEIVFPREAEQFPGYKSGDLLFILKQPPHAIYERIGNNLYADLEITLEARCYPDVVGSASRLLERNKTSGRKSGQGGKT